MTVHMDTIHTVYINGNSTELCESCLNNLKTPPDFHEPITAYYMCECVLCRALPTMQLQQCLDCHEDDIHPFDQYHAEGFCAV